MMKYILDTNVLSEAVKSAPNKHVMIMLEKHQAEIATASPVWHELQYGCRRLPVSRKREMIESFLEDVIRQNMIIFPYDERAAKWHAEERARLAGQGQMP
ncbi:MAG: PIN domain-containing protein, partial [Deltaproteobacteria bacterium]|nr:PIN domain-containing protein [Deltaproteobacteria bacterium]